MSFRNIVLRALLIPLRLSVGLKYYISQSNNLFRWLFASKEKTNFTYDLDNLNEEYLISFVSLVTGVNVEQIKKYVIELESDTKLADHIKTLTHANPRAYMADEVAKYGRRLGWYAIIRAKKPKLVVETGIDKGLGSCVIAAALMKNAEEGSEGHMYGTDINPRAGYLLQEPYSNYGKILYGDSIQSLEKLSEKIDIFINDSDHSSDYEMREYETIENKLSEGALILGDNAHCSDKLCRFANRTGRVFMFFQEKPRDHWYPGAGIGAAFKSPGFANI